MKIDREVKWKYPRAVDLEVRISKIRIVDEEFVDIREYVPSLDYYGRGLTLPANLVPDMEAVLQWF